MDASLCFADANVPETEAQRNKSLYGDRDCCYKHCDTPEGGVCYAKDCVDSSGSGSGSIPQPLHCAPLTISTPSPTDRSVAPQCIATSGGPTPPPPTHARNSSAPTRTPLTVLLVVVILVCHLVWQAVLVQRVATQAWRAVKFTFKLSPRVFAVAVLVARTWLRPMCATLLTAGLVWFCVVILRIFHQGYFAFTSFYCPSASEFKIMRPTTRSFSRPLLKLLIRTKLLNMRPHNRTTTTVTPNLQGCP